MTWKRSIRTQTFWSDRPVYPLLATALLINLSVYGYLIAAYPRLGETAIIIQYNQYGQPSRTGYLRDLFWMPLIGSLLFLANTGLGIALHRQERLACYLLLVTSITIQFVLLVASINILGLVRY